MYITIEEYTQLVGWTLTPAQEAQVEMLLPQTKQIIDNFLGDLTVWTKTIEINYDNVFFNNGITKIYTSQLSINSVVSINDVAYESNYKIWWSRWHIIYLDWDFTFWTYPFLEIEVNCWFEEIPSDIKLLQALLTQDLFNQLNWWDIETTKIWDKTLTFSSNTHKNRKQFIQSIFDSYKIHNV